jgi:hypothetical protein
MFGHGPGKEEGLGYANEGVESFEEGEVLNYFI